VWCSRRWLALVLVVGAVTVWSFESTFHRILERTSSR
jgi:hypothetical protein